MKKSVAEQIEELTPRERKIIFRAGMITEWMGDLLGVLAIVICMISFVSWKQAENDYADVREAYRAERETKGYHLSELTDYDTNLEDIEAASKRAVDTHDYAFSCCIISGVALLFYVVCSNIYLRKKVPHYTMRRFSYLFWSKKRRKILFEE